MYGITGRRFSHAQLELFQGMWKISASYPEPRIWNNRVAALGGSTRSTTGLSLGAAISVSDANLYGQGPNIRAFDFLQRAHVARQGGEALRDFVLKELKIQRTIPGYGRPIRSVDERLVPTERLARHLDLWDGNYTQLALDVATVLRPYRQGMNIAALTAALTADQGVSSIEFKRMAILTFSAGLIHCELDASIHPEGSLFPLRCARIIYQGPAHRVW
jgi:hypothetical protein